MIEELKTYQRWYDKDPIVSKCVSILENTAIVRQHRVAAFLMDEIIAQLPDDIYEKVMTEQRKRRWYDFDEVCKIFMELLRHSSEETKKQISVKIITFLEDNV
ncbi:MAG: hypothetical protein A2Y25_05685 [Candidatus Melainabacteria bacterium GWF2_37_15]|nr:MAG: hypothetical protein A2Y25_05685 [Candidatus Melainabacteria bacterium GWF2_37_15]